MLCVHAIALKRYCELSFLVEKSNDFTGKTSRHRIKGCMLLSPNKEPHLILDQYFVSSSET